MIYHVTGVDARHRPEGETLRCVLLHCMSAPNPICPSDFGGRAGCVTKPYKNYTVQILESELGLTHFCKAEANEIDFVPGPLSLLLKFILYQALFAARSSNST